MKALTTPLTIVAVFGLWEASCRAFDIPGYILPTPSEIAVSAWQFGSGWLPSIYETLLIVACGFGMALAVGFPLAVWIARSAVAYRAIYPLLVVKQSTPIVAIAPIIVVSFGTGLLAKALVAATVAVFPIVVATATGLMATPKEYLDLARSIHDDPWKALIRIRLPFAIRHIFSGLRVSITLAVIGAVVAEFVSAGRGLGYLVYSSTAFMRTSLAFAALVMLGIVGLCLFASVGIIQSTLFPWAKDVPEGDDGDG